MTYDPPSYWARRAAKHGRTYVARGGRKREYEKEYAAAVPFLTEAVPSPGRLLDFGCGSGRFRGVLSAENEYVGFDLVAGNGTVPFSTGLPRPEFDVIVATWVLQHIVDPAEYDHWTAEIYQALVPGGRLVVIDQDAGPGPYDPHMMPRGPEALMDTQPWTSGWVHSRWTHHWMGWLVK